MSARSAARACVRSLERDWSAQYADGHLLLLNGSTLMAQSFDPNTGSVTGSPTAIVATRGRRKHGIRLVLGVSRLVFWRTRPAFWLQANCGGSIGQVDSWRRSPRPTIMSICVCRQTTLVWHSHVRTSGLRLPTCGCGTWREAPNRGLTSQPLTDAAPVWSPAGEQIIFRSNRVSANLELFRTRPTAGAEAEIIYSGQQQRSAHGMNPSNVLSTDWSPDGRFMIYHVTTGSTPATTCGRFRSRESPNRFFWQARSTTKFRATSRQTVVGSRTPRTSPVDTRSTFRVFRTPALLRKQRSRLAAVCSHSGAGTAANCSTSGRTARLMAVAVRTRPTFEPGNVTPLFKTALPTKHERLSDGLRRRAATVNGS